MVLRVWPVIDYSVFELCTQPYPGHPKGCPNVGKCDRCPPAAPFFEAVFDLSQPVYAVINEFDLSGHVIHMTARHPEWSDRQLRCCLYWQGTARKQLKAKIAAALVALPGYSATWCPEGMGVDVTETMRQVGLTLWPMQMVARQIAFLAVPK